jgi:hypothetical protein
VLHAGQAGNPLQQQQQQQHYVVTAWSSTWCEPLHGLWSEWYKHNAREADNTTLAPWVEKRYRRYRLREQCRDDDGAEASSAAAKRQHQQQPQGAREQHS